MTTPEPTPCPVHAYGYHHQPRIAEAPGRTVFRHHSPIGLPARCARLEEELDEADRERDFIDELWLRERTTRGHGLALVGVAVAVAVVLALALGDAADAAVVAAAAVGGLAVALLDRADAAIHRERLRRVRDWHRRVGSPQ